MGSGLRARLNAMMAPVDVDIRNPQRSSGVLVRTSRIKTDPKIFDLPQRGLKRMGWFSGAFDVRRCLFLDTETTGLSGGAGTVAFLIGLGYIDDNDMVIEQYMMREYADEPEMIDLLSRRMDQFEYVCTYNGRLFDMPLLQTRFIMCRMQARWRNLENLDLLYPARRAWKLRLGSCRLSRIESEVLGMPRGEDLPGSEVPERFFRFLKNGDEGLLEDIFAHNRQDISTLSTLLVKLCLINDRPENLTDQRDLYSMGRNLERLGELKSAREIYRLSAAPKPVGTLAALTGERLAGMANWRQFLILRRSDNVEEALSVLKHMLHRRQMRGRVCVALSKIYEHRLKDYASALEYAEMASQFPDAEAEDELRRRILRIKARIEARTEEHS